jgi:aldehyde dehydrogenase family 7 member A1
VQQIILDKQILNMTLSYSKHPFLANLGLSEVNQGCYDGSKWFGSGKTIKTCNPSTGEFIAEIQCGTAEEYEKCMQSMLSVQSKWADTPAPRRGEIVRQIGDALRAKAHDLGLLVSLEMGKVKSEGLGEVQEFIDICDLACGMSRQIPGQVLPSERPGHLLLETWNPIGIVGIISAFNFPVAVYGWNSAISLIAGNCNIWKGASSVSLCTIATTKIVGEVLAKNGFPGVCTTVIGPGSTVGELLINDPRLKLVSFTGSTSVGRRVSEIRAKYFSRSILELGGNNASVIMEDADLEMAVRGSAFSAVGTAGQRCTSLRRLLIHESVFDSVVEKLKNIYTQIVANNVGDALSDSGVLLGPLHSEASYESDYVRGVEKIISSGVGKIIFGGKRINRPGIFVEPTLVEVTDVENPILHEEFFSPILYLIKISSFEEAVRINNSVPQGLSSSIYTRDMRRVFKWIGPLGSDCGIVNVNVGPSGAEIGGAFGGEKETGGGRESGSDSWKQYMRRGTCTINYSDQLPLAQGVVFDI